MERSQRYFWIQNLNSATNIRRFKSNYCKSKENGDKLFKKLARSCFDGKKLFR